MPMIRNTLGLDLGSHTVKAVELRQTFRGLEPVQQRVHPRADPDAPLPEILRRFFSLHDLSTGHITCSIAGDRVSSRRLELPFRDRKRLVAAVPFEIEAEIPFQLEDVIIDWEIVGGERNHSQVAATFAQRSQVAQLLADLREADCEPHTVEAEGLVLSNLASVFDLPGTRLLMDLGHRKTTYCLLKDEQALFARTVPVGSKQITEALVLDHAWSPEQAEQAKCEDGVFQSGFASSSPRALEVLDRLARESVRTLEAVEPLLGGSAQQQVAAIVLVGGGARLHRLDEYLSERTGIPTARLSMPAEPEGAAFVAGGDPLVFAPAIALALRGTTRARTRMNFRQDEFSYRASLREFFQPDLRPTAVMAGIAGALLLGSTVTSLAIEARRADQLQQESARLYHEALPGAPTPANLVTGLSKQVQSARELANFLGVYGGQHSALDLLSELSRRVPADLDVRFEEVAIDGRTIRVKAVAASFGSAERLVGELGSRAPFEAAKIHGEMVDKRGGKSFTILISLTDREEPA